MSTDLSKKVKTLLSDVGSIEKFWGNLNYDGVLDEWHEQCVEFLADNIGPVPPHSYLFATSAVFAEKYPDHKTDPDTYAVTRKHELGTFESMPEIVIDTERCLKMGPQSAVFNIIIALVEELLHVKYPEFNEAQIGDLTNNLTEKYLSIKLPERFREASQRGRRSIV
jgi:hypothetical protein